MDFEPRGRSSSRSRSNHISPQPSPHQYHDAIAESGFDPAVSNSTFTTGRFTQAASNPILHYPTPYSDPMDQQTHSQTLGKDTGLEDDSFNQAAFQSHQTLGLHETPAFNNHLYSNENEMLFGGTNATMQSDYGNADFNIDPNFDPNQPNVNPANLSKLSSPHASTPPNLLSPENHSSPGQPGSPASTQGNYYTPQHSRHQSLDPSSAAYPPGSLPPDWQGMTFQQHRRAPSDHSEISSNAPSPYLGHAELGDPLDNSHSPLISAQQDVLSALSIENFSINERPQSQTSPGHSPFMSPLNPQQTQGLGMAPDLMLSHGLSNTVHGPGPEIYTTQPDGAYGNMPPMHGRSTSLISNMGQADQYPAPTIKVEPAPVSRQGSFEPEATRLSDNLSPPIGSRGRSKSDPHVSRTNSRQMARSASPAGRPHSPSLSAISDRSVRSLSPGHGPISRESSPGASTGRIEKNRRQSTSSLPSRDYILDLADPNRQGPSQTSGRGQKHPATFQCHLCPKRFTRAYNLRSHLRTHTDERPFVCTVCGKAFARQHDRKRHEGLHSGEKKFVCKGELGSGNHWGCGRKFARADALGRHFRSEAGRICIKPLLDEEARDRAQNTMLEQQQQVHYAAGSLQPVQQPMMMNMDGSGGTGFALPAALLVQYPALNNIDWAAIPQGDDPSDLSDVGMGRNSFDAGTGGDYGYDESDINDGYNGNNELSYAPGGQGQW